MTFYLTVEREIAEKIGLEITDRHSCRNLERERIVKQRRPESYPG